MSRCAQIFIIESLATVIPGIMCFFLLLDVFTDWKICLLILGSWSNAVLNYALKFTMPEIITGMGYTSSRAQLLTIPPYAVGTMSAYAFSVFADRYTWRMPFIIVP